VQAAEQSGARITAQFALEQGREVFAIPGLIDDPLSAGCHALIQQGAKLTTSLQDVLAEFGYQSAPKDFMGQEIEIPIKRHPYAPESPEAQILELLTHSTCSVDNFMGHTGLDLVTLNAKLFDLQIAGLITQNFAGQWELI
jgi:DNA processing protein